ncbi:type II toxin-antitoxin system VapC family toxin [Methylobacterium trifolii]
MPYLDTSILVCALTNEAETARMQAWLGAQAAGDLTISAWVATELSAALSIKVRRGDLSPEHRIAALSAFARLSAESFVVLPIAERQFRSAAHFADRFDLGLRAGDALHLDEGADHGVDLAKLDRRLAEAGTALGVPATVP